MKCYLLFLNETDVSYEKNTCFIQALILEQNLLFRISILINQYNISTKGHSGKPSHPMRL